MAPRFAPLLAPKREPALGLPRSLVDALQKQLPSQSRVSTAKHTEMFRGCRQQVR